MKYAATMTACPSCGHENREGAKFCEECASPLAAPTRIAAEERKVVTALFVVLWLLVARPQRERIGKPTIRRRRIYRPRASF